MEIETPKIENWNTLAVKLARVENANWEISEVIFNIKVTVANCVWI